MARVQRSSPARRACSVVAGVLALAVLVVAAVALVRGPGALTGLLPGTSDCTATRGGTEVDLSTAEAERATRVAARSLRLELPLRTTTAAVAGELRLTDDEASVVAAAVRGRQQHALTCVHGGGEAMEDDRLDRRGLTGRAAAVRADLVKAFGRQALGGYAPGGVTTGHMPGSAHYEGRAIDVFYRPVTPAAERLGWATAHYLVAHAERLGIATVIYDGRIWTARRSIQGWRDYSPDTSDRSAQVAAVLEHRDHVHVDVAD